MSTVLHINNLSKNYGKVKALQNLDLHVEKGNIYGLLGPNGSGKTTTLGIILGVTNASSGEYSWFGEAPTAQVRRKIGAILESPTFYPYLSGEQNLKVICAIKQVPLTAIEPVLKMVNLFERKDDPFKGYSLGMKQRLAIASAMLADPSVLILDEPTNGLDPQGIAEIRELIVSIAQSGKTIILASHLLDEVQKVCTHFAVLKRGKKIYAGSVNEALAESETVEMSAPDMEALLHRAQSFTHLKSFQHENDKLVVKLEDGANVSDLHKHLIEGNIVLNHLTVKRKSLEKQFLELLAQAND
ncbi:ATP-binding cassette domain-containing protein [Cytophagales bacterium LB-30]|uniref:ATP-binding cassette domain-containing protein n=1 Tax=Shiella aurantiaca TaxID=3058365 RepID=A0ABT8F9R3_9BACT|nr:ATP-binding cassette domain-containing protein [Shiella aurantiaca]MDN4166989.1 ATP-binding cassette domain-containing protein [Shiella aurantiaca]